MNNEKEVRLNDLEVRYTSMEDAPYLKQWLSDPSVGKWFPMADEVEINDAVARWIGFARYHCSLTAVMDKIPCGITTLYLQPYKKLAHQCEFGIIVGPGYRGKGVGGVLLKNLEHLAKKNFNIELLHLQVYQDNPAMHLYERVGYKEFGYQKGWIKESSEFVGRIFMEKYI